MKQPSDKFTSEIFGNRPGRPRKLSAKNGAQRQREYRGRQSKKQVISVTSDEKQYCDLCISHGKQCSGICSVAQLGHKD